MRRMPAILQGEDPAASYSDVSTHTQILNCSINKRYTLRYSTARKCQGTRAPLCSNPLTDLQLKMPALRNNAIYHASSHPLNQGKHLYYNTFTSMLGKAYTGNVVTGQLLQPAGVGTLLLNKQTLKILQNLETPPKTMKLFASLLLSSKLLSIHNGASGPFQIT